MKNKKRSSVYIVKYWDFQHWIESYPLHILGFFSSLLSIITLGFVGASWEFEYLSHITIRAMNRFEKKHPWVKVQPK